MSNYKSYKGCLIVLLLLICLPVQAEQFKQFDNVIINKKYVTHAKIYEDGICMYYPAGFGDFNMQLASTCFTIKNREQKMKKFNEIKQWLNSKD